MKSETTAKLELADAVMDWLPPILNMTHAKAGEATADFILNQNSLRTKEHYFRILKRFLEWAEANDVSLNDIRAAQIKTYSEALVRLKGKHAGEGLNECSQAQVVCCLRGFFKALTLCGALQTNPALSVKAPRTHREQGAFPPLPAEDVVRILESFSENSLRDLQDRAVIALMVFACARVSAVVKLKRGDVWDQDGRMLVQLHEKGQKPHVVPLHREAERYVRAYMERSAGISKDCELNPTGHLFRRWSKGRKVLTAEPLNRLICYRMVKRTAAKLGIMHRKMGNHTFRATGITRYINADGLRENASRLANHASSETTKLYDHNGFGVAVEDVDLIEYRRSLIRNKR